MRFRDWRYNLNPITYRTVRQTLMRTKPWMWPVAMVIIAPVVWGMIALANHVECTSLTEWQCINRHYYAELKQREMLEFMALFGLFTLLAYSAIALVVRVWRDGDYGTLEGLRLSATPGWRVAAGYLGGALLGPLALSVPLFGILLYSLPVSLGTPYASLVLVGGAIAWTAQLMGLMLLCGRWRRGEGGPDNDLQLLGVAWLLLQLFVAFHHQYADWSKAVYPGGELTALPLRSMLSEAISPLHTLWYAKAYWEADEMRSLGWVVGHLAFSTAFSLGFLAFCIYAVGRKFQNPAANPLPRWMVYPLSALLAGYGVILANETGHDGFRLLIYAVFLTAWILVLPALLTPDPIRRRITLEERAGRPWSVRERWFGDAAPIDNAFVAISLAMAASYASALYGYWRIPTLHGLEWGIRIAGGLLTVLVIYRWVAARFVNIRQVYVLAVSLLAMASAVWFTLQAALENRGHALWPLLPPFGFFQVAVTTTPSEANEPWHLPIFAVQIGALMLLYRRMQRRDAPVQV